MSKLIANVLAWRLIDPDEALRSAEALAPMLEARPLKNPAASAKETTGWVLPTGIENHTHAVPLWDGNSTLISLGVAKRVLSNKVVAQLVAAKAAKIEEEEGRRVFAREKSRIKADILDEKLPRADIEYGVVHAVVSPPYLFVLTGSAATAEKLIDELRVSLPHGLKCVPVGTKTSPVHAFTRWFTEGKTVTGKGDASWSLGNKFEVHATASQGETLKGSWHFKDQEKLSDFVLSEGAKVTQLQMEYLPPEITTAHGGVTFMVNEMLGIKGIKWPSELTTLAADHQGDAWGEDAVADMLTSFNLSFNVLEQAFGALLDLLGGEALRDQPQDEDPTDEELI